MIKEIIKVPVSRDSQGFLIANKYLWAEAVYLKYKKVIKEKFIN